jgi:hypothetical protein
MFLTLICSLDDPPMAALPNQLVQLVKQAFHLCGCCCLRHSCCCHYKCTLLVSKYMLLCQTINIVHHERPELRSSSRSGGYTASPWHVEHAVTRRNARSQGNNIAYPSGQHARAACHTCHYTCQLPGWAAEHVQLATSAPVMSCTALHVLLHCVRQASLAAKRQSFFKLTKSSPVSTAVQ